MQSKFADAVKWCALSVFCVLVVAVCCIPAAKAEPALLLFGGDNHKTFLGCLNCLKYDTDSVCNKYGNLGSKYSSNSIWNQFGEYGSKFSAHSPWNKYSTKSPIIVDKAGNSYGYFSANLYHNNRTHDSWFISILDYAANEDDLDKTRDFMCGK